MQTDELCVLRDWNRLGPECQRVANSIYFEFGFAMLRAVETVFHPECTLNMTAQAFFPTFIKVDGGNCRFSYGWVELTTVQMHELCQYQGKEAARYWRKTPYGSDTELWFYLYGHRKWVDGRYRTIFDCDESIRIAEAFRYIGEGPPAEELTWVTELFHSRLQLIAARN